MALRLAFGFDVPAQFDQGDQAIEPGPILKSRRAGEPADSFAEFAGGLGLADAGREVEPGPGEQQLGLGLSRISPGRSHRRGSGRPARTAPSACGARD